MDLDKKAKSRFFVIIIIIYLEGGGGWGKSQGVWSGGLGGGQCSVDTQRTGLLHH